MKFLTFPAAFVFSVLSGMGVGGGGLFVIWLSLVLGKEQLEAQGINLIFFLFCSAAALAVNIGKRKFNIRKIIALSVPGSVFAVIGSILASYVETAILRKIFGALLVISGAVSLYKTVFARKGG